MPRGYGDLNDEVEKQRCELLNVSSAAAGVRMLLDPAKPSALSIKGVEGNAASRDWVESDTDPQLLLFMPFQSMIKLHTLQVRSALHRTLLPTALEKAQF